jgi:hypothetical protein
MTEHFVFVGAHMNVTWRMVANPPKYDVSAAPEAFVN